MRSIDGLRLTSYATRTGVGLRANGVQVGAVWCFGGLCWARLADEEHATQHASEAQAFEALKRRYCARGAAGCTSHTGGDRT
jgi:hypothetical protein